LAGVVVNLCESAQLSDHQQVVLLDSLGFRCVSFISVSVGVL